MLVSTRTAAGYREYDESAVTHVERIRRFLKLGYTLMEAGEVLLPLDARPFRVICADVIALHRKKLETVREEILRLTEIHAQVEERVTALEAQRRKGGPEEPARRISRQFQPAKG